MTTKEILDAQIDKYFAMVPPADLSDFARKLPVPAYMVSILAMEEYTEMKVKEVKEDRDKAVDMLDECRLQLENLDKRFPTCTTANVLSRVETFLNSLKQQQ